MSEEKMKRWRGLFCLLCALFPLLSANFVTAQTDGGNPLAWSAPVNLSNTSGAVSWSLIAADQTGRVHVVWDEGSGTGPLDAISYTYSDGSAWSDPVDVLVAQTGRSATPDTLLVDAAGNLVLLWHEQDRLNISIADAAGAGSARVWKTSALDVPEGVRKAALALDPRGGYHLVYVRGSRDLVHTFSMDGADWAEEQHVSGVASLELALDWPCIAADASGLLYVSWTQNAEWNNWSAVGVWFTRSTDGGASWEPARETIGGAGYTQSTLFVDQQQILHLFWIGSLQVGGRYHRWSDDQGETWAATQMIARPDEIRGAAGPCQPLLDSRGALHLVFTGLGRGRDRIWHSRWEEENWQEPEVVSADLPDSQAVAAAMSLRHRIHVVWIEYASGDIWYSSLDTGAPALPTQPPRAPAPTATRSEAEAATRAPATPIAANAPLDAPPVELPAQSLSLLALSLAPAVLLLSVVSLFRVAQRRRR